MSLPLPVLVPLACACVYAIAAIMLKRATEGGIGPWRVSFVTNWVQAAVLAPMWLLGGPSFEWLHLWHAILTGAAFFVGQVFTFLALSRGDVSVATPVLGTKVILVALFTVLLTHDQIPASWWWAAVLTAVATALLGSSRPQGASRGAIVRSMGYGFSAATAFALTDALTQKWAKAWGFAHFAPAMVFTVAVFSFLLIPHFQGPLRSVPRSTWRWLIPGASLLGVQACGLAFAIITFGSATLVNILYSSRGVWTVAIVWAVGHWFENHERGQGHGIMVRRLCGSLVLLVAIALAKR